MTQFDSMLSSLRSSVKNTYFQSCQMIFFSRTEATMTPPLGQSLWSSSSTSSSSVYPRCWNSLKFLSLPYPSRWPKFFPPFKFQTSEGWPDTTSHSWAGCETWMRRFGRAPQAPACKRKALQSKTGARYPHCFFFFLFLFISFHHALSLFSFFFPTHLLRCEDSCWFGRAV